MTTTEAVATLRRMADPNSHWLSAREKEALGLAVELLEPKPDMTLEEAVKVLNEKEIGDVEWRAEHGVASLYIDGRRHRVDSLGKFMAKAVAKELIRLKGGA